VVSVSDVRRLTDSTVLVHFNAPSSGEQSAEYRSCLAVVDVRSGRAKKQVSTAVPAGSMFRTRVAYGGRYVLAIGDGLIEIRRLPSLELAARREVEQTATSSAAVSADGRFVAYGWRELRAWDSTKDEMYVLDQLNKRVAESDELVIAEDYRDSAGGRSLARDQLCIAVVSFVKDEGTLAGVTRDGWYCVWDLVTRRRLARVRICEVLPLCWAPH